MPRLCLETSLRPYRDMTVEQLRAWRTYYGLRLMKTMKFSTAWERITEELGQISWWLDLALGMRVH